MALVVTTQALIDEIRLLSNLKRNNYFSDADILRFVNDAKDKLFDLIVETYEHYFVKTFDFTLANGVATNALPTDFYKACLMEVNPGTPQKQKVDMLSNYLDRDAGQGALSAYYGPGQDRRYFVEGDHLLMLGNVTDGVYRLYYTPLLGDFAFPLSVDMSVPRDHTVRLVTDNPLDAFGTWTQITANDLQFTPTPTPPPFYSIDNRQPVLGDEVLFLTEDAPLSPTNVGVWTFTGIVFTGGSLIYTWTRATGYRDGDVIIAGHKIGITDGDINADTTWISQTGWVVGTTHEAFTPANLTNATGSPTPTNNYFKFYNAVVDPDRLSEAGDTTFMGGKIRVISSRRTPPAADFVISSAPDTHAANVNYDVFFLGSGTFALADDTALEIFLPNLIYQLPQQLVPWALLIKVHAARTIRAARQQDTSQLDAQFASEERRVMKLAANRTEDVTEAPYSRRRGGRYLGGC